MTFPSDSRMYKVAGCIILISVNVFNFHWYFLIDLLAYSPALDPTICSHSSSDAIVNWCRK